MFPEREKMSAGSPRLFTVDEYQWMGRVGILIPAERVELIAGQILKAAPIRSLDASCVKRTAHLFGMCFYRGERQGRAIVSVRNPVDLDRFSEPEPDLGLLRHREDFYSEAHPRPEDVLLLVEAVTEENAALRRLKIPLYAQRGIQETWVADLDRTRVEVHRDPGPDGYRQLSFVGREEGLSPLAFPDLCLTGAEILG
jgi:hypothetical protein